MNMKKSFLLLCGCLAIASACCNRPAKTAGINYAYMDTTARPGDDFAKYATGHWTDLNPQPLEYPMWGTVAKVSDENVKALAELIKDIAAQQNEKGSVAQKIGDLYSMMMDSTRLNAEGAAPIKAHIAELDAINTREELLSRCAKEHDNLLFAMYISTDQKDADNNAAFLPVLRQCLGRHSLRGDNALSHDDGRSLNRPPEDQRSTRPVRLLVRRLRHPTDRFPLRQARGQGTNLVRCI